MSSRSTVNFCRTGTTTLVGLLLFALHSTPVLAHAHISDAAHSQHAKASYLANEGVLVELDDTKVLFDAFFSNGYGNYALVPAAKVAALHAGAPPYDGIDALFISHAHGDHFSPQPTLAYLRAQPQVQLFGPAEAVAALLDLVPENDPVRKRCTPFALNPGDAAQQLLLGEQNINIDVVAIPHAGGKRMEGVRNLVFRVTLNDQLTVMHMGDAAPTTRAFAEQQPHWDKRTTHHAFPPYWFFEAPDGSKILKNHIRPLRATGVHVPAAAVGNGDEWRTRLGADLFTDPGEERLLHAN